MTSCIYEGTVRHRRFAPRWHAFSYRVAMLYLRLDEIPALFAGNRLWSCDGRAPAEFRRSDYLGDPSLPLIQEVRRRIREETGTAHRGPIYLLANVRLFGFVMNPIACYYCYSEDGDTLQYIVAEVTNTPWDERHSYVLPVENGEPILRTEFDKAMHVSPFNPMDMRYHWRSNQPGQRLVVHLENHREGDKVMDATLALRARPLTRASLNRMLWTYPLATLKTAAAIYYQALKLYIKRMPIYAHPATSANGQLTSGASNE